MEKYHFSEKEQSIFEGLQQPFAIYQYVNKSVVTIALSDGFCNLFGYEDRALAYHNMDHNMYKDTHPDDAARIANAAVRFAANEAPYDVVYRAKKNGGSEYHIIHSKGKHVYTDTGVRLAHVWYLDEGVYSEDSLEHKTILSKKLNNALHEESLVKTNRFDYLTGLPNMTYFFELVELGRENIKKTGAKAALLFIDLNGMKFFNSKHGFSEGDKLLQAFARVLSRNFNNENCCHISGDHFAVYTTEEGLEDRLNRLFKECREINNGKSLPVRVGIYPTSLEEVPVSVACDRAKFACDALRSSFESCFNYYNQTSNDDAERRQYILSNLDRALEEKWIQVYYQPIVRAVNGRVCDEEALARWIDPVRGFMSPGLFIPFLEEAGQIYKLDIYILERVLEKIKKQQELGFNVVPHSINFSRSDFDAWDVVEEVRRRVDEAGISHDMITIELTESAVGSSFDFMKDQIARFSELGFPVWMDDFGSGYSSLDVLSSIRFNLIKFDMVFMRKFDEDKSRKIILTELMRMATSLGVDTICEGVETDNQVRFLREIGCSKLQGFYYSKPIPLEAIIERYEKGIQIGYEDPDQAKYYEAMGRVNLYDLSMIANDDDHSLNNFFNTLPIGIMELQGEDVHFVRSNPSFRDFIKRFFGFEMTDMEMELSNNKTMPCIACINFIKQCCHTTSRMVYDAQMPDRSVAHAMAKRIVQDPKTGKTAVAVAILSISEPNEGTDYATIARVLAADYYNIYYVNVENDKFIEYTSPVGGEELAMERHGEHFFEAARRDTMTRIYEEDRVPFLLSFTKENVLRVLDEAGSFTATYRLIDTGEPVYASMKIMRMHPTSKHLIIGISIVDSEMKQRKLSDTIQTEETVYTRIMALSGGYLSLYTVDTKTGEYFEYNASSEYDSFGFAKRGEDFFQDGIINVQKIVYSEDLPLYMSRFTKDNVLEEIRQKGVFLLQYRIMSNGEIKEVLLKIVSVKENGNDKLIVGLRLWKSRK